MTEEVYDDDYLAGKTFGGQSEDDQQNRDIKAKAGKKSSKRKSKARNKRDNSSDHKKTDNNVNNVNNGGENYITLLESEIEQIAAEFNGHHTQNHIDALIILMFNHKISLKSTEQVIAKIPNNIHHNDRRETDNEHAKACLESRLKRNRQIYLDGSRTQKIPTIGEIIQKIGNSTFVDRIKDLISHLWKRHLKLPSSLKGLPSDVLTELFKHTFELISEKPLSLVIARGDTKQIIQAVIDYPNIKGADPDIEIDPSLYFKDIIIQAIPTKIIRHEDAASPDIKYEIEFETPLGHKFKTDPLPLENIVDYLKCKGLVYKMRVAGETLAQILQAYERDGKIQVTHNIEATGFFLIDGKIECFGFEFKRPTKESMNDCGLLMTKLVVDKYHSDKRLPTLLMVC
jgi:hypothetical protein